MPRRRGARRIALYAYAVFFGLVACGFLLAAGIDTFGAAPAPPRIGHLSGPARVLGVVLLTIIGIPIALGMALYVVVWILDFAMFITSPFRAVARARRRGGPGDPLE